MGASTYYKTSKKKRLHCLTWIWNNGIGVNWRPSKCIFSFIIVNKESINLKQSSLKFKYWKKILKKIRQIENIFTLTTSQWPLLIADLTGDNPRKSGSLGLSTMETKNLVTSTWPYLAASWVGVYPSGAGALASSAAGASNSTIFACPKNYKTIVTFFVKLNFIGLKFIFSWNQK